MEKLAKLPDRDLVMCADLMEIAYADDAYVYLVTLTPTVGQPTDPTKEELDVSLSVLDKDSGDVKLAYPRQTTLTMYDDASAAIGTPADHDPVATIMDFVEAQLPLMAASASRLLDQTPLYQRLAAAVGSSA